MTVKTLDDLFLETLKDLYYAEKKLVQTLPKMAKRPPLQLSRRPLNAISAKPKPMSRGWKKFSQRWTRSQPPRSVKLWKGL